MYLRLLILFLTALLFSSCTREKFINESGNLVPLTVDEDPTLPSISVNGALLHAEAFGQADAPLIIILHGGPGADYRYLLNCTALADEGYRVVFFDQRGAGLSQRFPYKSYSLPQAFEDLTGVIAHYKIKSDQKVFLLGHSWGAMLATAYVDRYPDAIQGAILGEPGGFIWSDVESYVSRSRKISVFSESLNDAVYLEQFLSGASDEHAVLDYKFGLWADAETSSPIGNEGRLPTWRGGAVCFNALYDIGTKEKPNWTTHLHQFKHKVLFIYSENNKAYGLGHAQKVSSPYPEVELFETKGAGHDMLSFPTGWNNTFPKMISYLNSLK